MNEMNVSKLSQRDLERLSAYLDGELDAKQTARVEARLEREPLLRNALEELQQTARLLRSMPQVTLPRHFALTPEMVASRKTRYAYPALKLASALVTAVFVFVLGIDVFGAAKGSGEFLPNLSQRSIAEAPAMEADMEVAEDMAAASGEGEGWVEEEAAAPLVESAAEAYEEEFAMGESVEGTQLPEPEIPAEEMEELEEIAPEEPTSIGKTVDEADAVEGVDNGVEAMTDEAQLDGEVDAAPTMIVSLQDDVGADDVEIQDEGWSLGQIEPIRILEIGLAILCILLISATLLLRVSSR